MIRPRIIPVLLLRDEGLVKGVRFKDYKYVGDPINAVKIFSDKEVDELFIFDISATNERRPIPVNLVRDIADEAYMPFCVGGGIRSIEDIQHLLSAGAEKVCFNTAAIEKPDLIEKAANIYGSQCIVVSIDVRKKWMGHHQIYSHSGKIATTLNPVDWAKNVEDLGAGELLITSIDFDGTMKGYDKEIISKVAEAVTIPVIACGGAGSLHDIFDVIQNAGASAAAAGSLFVFHGPKRAVLINYPNINELNEYNAMEAE